MVALVSGIGVYLPRRTLPNQDLLTLSGLEPQWVEARTGITRRLLTQPGVDSEQMAAAAGREALAMAGTCPEAVTQLLVTSSFQRPFPAPSLAQTVAAKLGLLKARLLDLATPGTGFLEALRLAVESVERGGAAALVIAAEGFSEATKLRDRRSCYLASDGAAALLITAAGGFARLGPFLVEPGYGGNPEGTAEPAREREAAQLRALVAQGLSHHAGSAAPLHLLTPRLGEVAAQLRLPSAARLFDPWRDTADPLSASLPTALHRLLAEGAAKAGARALLAAVGPTQAQAVLLEILELPERLARHPAGPGAELAGPYGEHPPKELRQRFLGLVAQTREVETLFAIVLRLRGVEGLDDDLLRRTQQEAFHLLRRCTRDTDALFKLEGSPCFCLLARHLDAADAQRLGDRLRDRLEGLDLIGELRFQADMELVRHRGSGAPDAFADEVLDRLTA